MMAGSKRVKLWDLPLRLFHWLLLIAILGAWISAENGYLSIHYYFGLTIITLLSFRILWGIWGSSTARFTHFVKGLPAIKQYLSKLRMRKPSHTIGHNALAGAWVMALLFFVGLQALTGLFSHDDIVFDGPFADNVSSTLSGILSEYHEINFKIILALIVLHLLAQLYYFFWKKENLVGAMIEGSRLMPEDVVEKAVQKGDLQFPSLARAFILFLPGLFGVLAVYFLNK